MLPTKEELASRYAKYGNERLLDIVYKKESYTADAIEVARKELHLRNISVRDLDEYFNLKEYRARKEEERMKNAAYFPLSLSEKILFFIAFFLPLIINIAFGINYAKEGLKTKSKQSKIFALSGFSALLITIYMAVNYHYSSQKFIFLFFLFFLLTFFTEKRFRNG